VASGQHTSDDDVGVRLIEIDRQGTGIPGADQSLPMSLVALPRGDTPADDHLSNIADLDHSRARLQCR
jgi:hypothetical protein